MTNSHNQSYLMDLVTGLVGDKCKDKLTEHNVTVGAVEFYCVCYKLCDGRVLTEEERSAQKEAIQEIMSHSHDTIDADSLIIIVLYSLILAIGIFGK